MSRHTGPLLWSIVLTVCVGLGAPAMLSAQETPTVTESAPKAVDLINTYRQGFTWLDLDLGLTTRGLSAVDSHPTQSGFLSFGGDNGIILSPDNGQSWRNILILEGKSTSTSGPEEDGGTGSDNVDLDLDSRRQALIDERAEERYAELREETLSELESDVDSDYAEQLVEELEQELREQARVDVISEELDDIENELREESDQPEDDSDEPKESSDTDTVNLIDVSVGHILFDPNNPRGLWAATHVGLLHSTNLGQKWDALYEDRNRTPTKIAIATDAILLGTVQGLQRSTNNGGNWDTFGGVIGNEPIVDVVAYKDVAYVATPMSLFSSVDAGATWQRLGLPSALGNSTITALDIGPNDPSRIAIGSNAGAFLSEDAGLTFLATSSTGLSDRNIRDIVFHPQAPEMLLVATAGGVFALAKSQGWVPLVEGLSDLDIRSISVEASAPYTLFAASEQTAHIFSPRGTDLEKHTKDLDRVQAQWAREPQLPQVLRAAARYAQLERGNWKSFQTRAKWKHLLPSVKGRAIITRQRVETDRLLVQGFGGAINRDRSLLIREDNLAWEVMATWDLASVIFNDNEVAASKRIIDQLKKQRKLLKATAKLYAKRRTSMLTDALRPKKSPHRAANETLKIQEMTARLDALTGGLFSASDSP